MRAINSGLGVVLILLLAACGESAVKPSSSSDLLTGTKSTPQSKGPVLRAPRVAAPSGTHARMVEDGELVVPEGATWKSLRVALEQSRLFRMKREGLDDDEPRTYSGGPHAMCVDLPGVKGYVIVGGEVKPYGRGLVVRLTRSDEATGVAMHARGPDWLKSAGCGATTTRWSTVDAGVDTFTSVFKSLTTSQDNKYLRYVELAADQTVPAADVIACIAAATNANIDIWVLPTAGSMDTPVDRSLQWLAAHQLKHGGWNEELSPGYCDGERLTHVEIPDEVDAASDVAPTSLALLAFLSAGYTNRGRHRFARVVGIGMRHLMKIQADDGDFGGEPRDHIIATLAMLTIYRMTGSPIFGKPARQALAYLPHAWRMCNDDLSATALTAMCVYQVRAINSDREHRGRPAAFDEPEAVAPGVLVEANKLMRSIDNTRAAAGTAALLLLGGTPDTQTDLATAVERVRNLPLRIQAAPIESWCVLLVKTHGVYPCVARRIGKLTPPQHEDGHACCLMGSFNPVPGAGIASERIAATALGCLCMQGQLGYATPWH